MSKQLVFRYGTMDSSKSMNLIAAVHNYKSKGDNVLVFKPSTDTRSKTGFVESRTGIKAECIEIDSESSILVEIALKNTDIACVFIDECQFLTELQVMELLKVVDNLKIPVLAYGLRTNFAGEFFPATNLLMRHADKIEEIKTICHVKGCNKKAIYNQRLVDGVPVFNGESVVIGDTKKAKVSYTPKCRFHYMKDHDTYKPSDTLPNQTENLHTKDLFERSDKAVEKLKRALNS
jgi:thymidine kinase